MIKKSVLREIDRILKEIWIKNIQKDYFQENMINEDCLKDCMYYHMRRRMATLLKENNLRIFTEFNFTDLKYRADMIIAEIHPEREECWKDSIHKEDIVAIIELKFTCGANIRTEEWVKHDTVKFKNYMQNGSMECQYYFAVIYEVECSTLSWMDKRSTNNWADGYVTELNAGYINGKMKFGIDSYNGMNKNLQTNM